MKEYRKAATAFLFTILFALSAFAGLEFSPERVTIIQAKDQSVGLSVDGITAVYVVKKSEAWVLNLAIASAISLGAPLNVDTDNATLYVGKHGPDDAWLIDGRYIVYRLVNGRVEYFFAKQGFPALKIAEVAQGDRSDFANFVSAAQQNGGFIEVTWRKSKCSVTWPEVVGEVIDPNSLRMDSVLNVRLIPFNGLLFYKEGRYSTYTLRDLKGEHYIGNIGPWMSQTMLDPWTRKYPGLDILCYRDRLWESYIEGKKASTRVTGQPLKEDWLQCRLVSGKAMTAKVAVGQMPPLPMPVSPVPFAASAPPAEYQQPPANAFELPPPFVPGTPASAPQYPPLPAFVPGALPPVAVLFDHVYTPQDVWNILTLSCGVKAPKHFAYGDRIIFAPHFSEDQAVKTIKKHYKDPARALVIPMHLGGRWAVLVVNLIPENSGIGMSMAWMDSSRQPNEVSPTGITNDIRKWNDFRTRNDARPTVKFEGQLPSVYVESDLASSGPLMVYNILHRHEHAKHLSDVSREEMNRIREEHAQLLAKYGLKLDTEPLEQVVEAAVAQSPLKAGITAFVGAFRKKKMREGMSEADADEFDVVFDQDVELSEDEAPSE